MARQIGQVIIQLVSEHRLQRHSGTLVQEFAAVRQHRVVTDLQGQGMLEGVFDIAHRGLLVDELGELQRGQHPLQFII